MSDRLEDECKLRLDTDFQIRDLPRDEKQLREMPFSEFQDWTVIALGGIPNKTKVNDKGVDGRIYPATAIPQHARKRPGHLDFMDAWYPVQVKQVDKAGRPDIDSFETAMRREGQSKGFFVSFDYSKDAMREISRFFTEEQRVIVALTVREILDEEIAMKLA